MRESLRGLRAAAQIVWVLLIGLLPAGCKLGTPASAQQVDTLTQVETGSNELSQEKLRHEIRKLELENEKLSSRWNHFSSVAPALTAVVAVLGAVLTLWKQIAEARKSRKEEIAQREKDSQRRFDERFTKIVENLGSESPALQAQSAASLRTFLRPRYQEFYEDVFVVLLANLKIQRERVVQDLLTRVFGEAVRIKAHELRRALDGTSGRSSITPVLELSRTTLAQVDLADVDLRGVEVDLAFANLERANLTGVKMPRVRGYGMNLQRTRLSRADLQEARLNKAQCDRAQFHAGNLVSATLKGARLQGAQFHQARMQGAHLERADLRQARFEEAKLSDAYFYDCTFDPVALRSITRAYDWQKAHFDPEVKQKLEEIERRARGQTV